MMLRTDRLLIRNWRDSDRDLFCEINSDPKVMEFFPRRRGRAECDVLMDEARRRIDATGFGFFAVCLKEADEPIGFCGLAETDLEPFLRTGTIEIGWRLAFRFWGHGYATEAATALLRYGFAERHLPEIVSFAVAANNRSTAVMKRLGMRRDPARDFQHPRVPPSMARLRHHEVYALTSGEWQALQ